MDEETESRMVTLKCVELVDPGEWTNTIPGFEVAITFGSQDLTMRIDANTNLFGQPAPIGVFGVTGIGGQRDYNAPLVDGYTITPRGQFDLTEPVVADFLVVSPWDGSNGPVEIFNLSTGAGSYLWSMGDGSTYQDNVPVHSYSESGTFTIILTAFSEDGECSVQTTGEIVSNWTSVEEIASNEISAFPNPTTGQITIELKGLPVSGWSLFDSKGSLVASQKEVVLRKLSLDLSKEAPGIYSLVLGEGYSPVRIVLK
jgi:PKD repeat protein